MFENMGIFSCSENLGERKRERIVQRKLHEIIIGKTENELTIY